MNRHVITNRNENQNFDQDEQALSGIGGTNADAAAVEDNNIEVDPTDNDRNLNRYRRTCERQVNHSAQKRLSDLIYRNFTKA